MRATTNPLQDDDLNHVDMMVCQQDGEQGTGITIWEDDNPMELNMAACYAFLVTLTKQEAINLRDSLTRTIEKLT